MGPDPPQFLGQRDAKPPLTGRPGELPKQKAQTGRGFLCRFSPPLENVTTVGMKGFGRDQRKGQKVKL